MLFCVATETGENMWSQEVESWHNALRWCIGEDVEEVWEWEHAHKHWEPNGWDGPFYLFEVSGDDGLLWKSDQLDADKLARELLEDEEKDGEGVLRLLVIPTGEILWEIATGSWQWALRWASKLVEREAAREDILAQAERGVPYYEISVFCPEGKVWSSAEAEWRTLADEGAHS